MTSASIISYLKTTGKSFLSILTCRLVPNLLTDGPRHQFATTRETTNFFRLGLGGLTLGKYS